MAKNFALHIDLQVSPDALFTQFLFKGTYARLDASLLTETSTPTHTIPTASEEALPMGDITTGNLLYLRSTRQVTVKITSSAGSAQALVVGSAAAVGGILLFEGEFTAVSVLNNSGDDVEVTAFLGGA